MFLKLLKTANKGIVFFRDFIGYNVSVYRSQSDPEILKKNIELKNMYKGKIFLLFTGTSIKNIQPHWFKDKKVMAFNLFWLHPDFEDFNIDFFANIEPWSHEKYAFLKWIYESVYVKTDSNTKVFISSSAYHSSVKIARFRSEKTYYISHQSSPSDNILNNNFETCYNNASMDGVADFGISMAIYMGFKEIYLVGADYSKQPVVSGHFYDGIHGTKESDPATLEKNKLINHFAKKRGVRIINVIDDGFQSPVFESINTERIKSL